MFKRSSIKRNLKTRNNRSKLGRFRLVESLEDRLLLTSFTRSHTINEDAILTSPNLDYPAAITSITTDPVVTGTPRTTNGTVTGIGTTSATTAVWGSSIPIPRSSSTRPEQKATPRFHGKSARRSSTATTVLAING